MIDNTISKTIKIEIYKYLLFLINAGWFYKGFFFNDFPFVPMYYFSGYKVTAENKIDYI